jgi:hypothetical protein
MTLAELRERLGRVLAESARLRAETEAAMRTLRATFRARPNA